MKKEFEIDYYYVLARGKGDDMEFFVEWDYDGVPQTCDDITELEDAIYTERSRENLEVILDENKERFNGEFRIVKVVKNSSYTVED